MSVFEVAIGYARDQGKFRVQVVDSPVGHAAADVELDVAALLAGRSEFENTLLLSSVVLRRNPSDEEKTILATGKTLFAALLGSGEVAGRYRAAAAVADERGEELRIVLRIDAPELAALPWEAMYDEGAGSYVCRRYQLVRHVPVASAAPPLAVRTRLRILGIVASPTGLDRLDARCERDQLASALSEPIKDGLVELVWAPSATWNGIQDQLMKGPWHAVHFIGHGDFDPDRDEGRLGLTAEDGTANVVEASRFVDLLRQAKPLPRLVVLNSCQGGAASTSDLFAGTAASLARSGVAAVTAMQYSVTDTAAIAFARGFYSALARARGIDEAVSSGRVAILGTSGRTLEWLTPILYLRGHDSRLFAMTEAQDAIPAPPPAPIAQLPAVTAPQPAAVRRAADPARPPKAPAVWGDLPFRNRNFTGRAELLDLLRRQLDATPGIGAARVLHGLIGVGKTQVALEYAYRYRSEYDVVWWVQCDKSPTAVRASLAALAERLGLDSASSTGIDRAVAWVVDALRRGEPYDRCLLIFDNADRPEVLQGLLPDGPAHLLITSCNPQWRDIADAVEVDVFSRYESVEFLSGGAGRNINESAAVVLAEALGNLPLALAQAAILVDQGMSPAHYAQLLQEQPADLLAQGHPYGYGTTVTAALRTGMGNLGRRSVDALALLRCLAFIGDRPIPLAMLRQHGGAGLAQAEPVRKIIGDPILVSQALNNASRLGLARIDRRGDTVQIHRVTAAMLRDELSPAAQDEFRLAARFLVRGG
jgi:hypothetical protein